MTAAMTTTTTTRRARAPKRPAAEVKAERLAALAWPATVTNPVTDRDYAGWSVPSGSTPGLRYLCHAIGAGWCQCEGFSAWQKRCCHIAAAALRDEARYAQQQAALAARPVVAASPPTAVRCRTCGEAFAVGTALYRPDPQCPECFLTSRHPATPTTPAEAFEDWARELPGGTQLWDPDTERWVSSTERRQRQVARDLDDVFGPEETPSPSRTYRLKEAY